MYKTQQFSHPLWVHLWSKLQPEDQIIGSWRVGHVDFLTIAKAKLCKTINEFQKNEIPHSRLLLETLVLYGYWSIILGIYLITQKLINMKISRKKPAKDFFRFGFVASSMDLTVDIYNVTFFRSTVVTIPGDFNWLKRI